MEATMMQNPDVTATANPSAPIERRFEAVVNFADAVGVAKRLDEPVDQIENLV
jgi:hypothetical protein